MGRGAARALPAGLALSAVALAAACAPDEGEMVPADPPTAAAAADVHRAFLENLAHHCGEAFPGQVVHAPDDDPNFAGDPELVMHVQECSGEEVRIPVFLGEDRSRTWIFWLTGDGVDLRHDHRNPDGSPESNTWYGAHTPDAGSAQRQEFLRPAQEGQPRTGWAIEIVPGERYTYGTIRDGDWTYRLDFDLSTPVDEPPAPWGHEGSTAAR